MMHQAAPSSTVVVLEDANTGAPFREFDHTHLSGGGSRVRVVMPFNTEYKFRFKFPGDYARRRLELRIDGTVVAKDLIVVSSTVLERFLDSAKRFKFVKAASEGVADPTSPSNGLITVKLWREKDKPLQTHMLGMLRGVSDYPSTHYGARGSSAGESLSSDHVFMSSMSVSKGPSYEAGATVEGRDSTQRFGTTQWEGDADPLPQVFEFQLVGRVEQVAPGAYCSQCGGKQPAEAARYCTHCGARR
jgi:hypothetical protein